MCNTQTLVINVKSNIERRQNIASRLGQASINFNFVQAVEPIEFTLDRPEYLTDTAKAVWLSHRKCLELSASVSQPTLILEDDAVLNFNATTLDELSGVMIELDLDFIQIGYLKINLAEGFSIILRNFYSFFTRKARGTKLFELFGFMEVGRAKDQSWRNSLPKNFIVNDVRYGAHCYLISPNFASKLIDLNDPPFLPADDFYVALSRAKSFKMLRLMKSKCSQDGTQSSFQKRFLLS
jgi:GR25 family glycosyltransferase involved in LPS biosynthesis